MFHHNLAGLRLNTDSNTSGEDNFTLIVKCFSLQGSLDNISVIIVCFPGAPELSQEALQEEAALEQRIDSKVEGDLFFPAKL